MKIKKMVSLLLALIMVIGMSLSGIFHTDVLDAQATEVTEAAEAAQPAETAEQNESTFQVPPTPDDAVIADGVFIGDFDLSGVTKIAATQMISNYIDSLSSREIILNISGHPEQTTAQELGFSWLNPQVVDEAAAFGTRGNLIVRYMELKDIKVDNHVLDLQTSYDDAKIEAFVNERGAKYNVAVKEATLTKNNGVFVVTDDVVGITVDIGQTMDNLVTALKSDLKPDQLVLDASVVEVKPTRTAALLSQVHDVLGTYSTKYNAGNIGRSKNLATGVGKINGIVLMPGQSFSGYEVMSPFTVSNGYAAAGAYENGVVIESVGGGACQIATTLYNALLLAELEVTQRQNHSMIVSYVPYSQDAAIAGTYKDIKFVNNYEYPIYLEGWASKGNIGFTIYGKETRPSNRTIKYVSVTLSESMPTGSINTEDPSLPAGTQKVTQGAYPAVSSQLWKYIFVNGVQTEKILMHSDKYASSLTRLSIGTGAAAPANGVPEENPDGAAPASEIPAAVNRDQVTEPDPAPEAAAD